MRTVRLILALLATTALVQAQKPLTLEDIMKFRSIDEAAINDSGNWLHYQINLDRGDGEYVFRSTRGSGRYTIANGNEGKVSPASDWGAAFVSLPAAKLEAMDKKARKDLKKDAVLINLSDGQQVSFERIKDFDFSKDGAWVALLHHAPEAADKDKKKDKKDKGKDEVKGGKLILRKLASGHEITVEAVTNFAFSGKGGYIAYATRDPEGNRDGSLRLRHLAADHSREITLASGIQAVYPQLAFDEQDRHLAWLEGTVNPEGKLKHRQHALVVWEAKRNRTTAVPALAAGMFIPHFQKLRWSEDGERVFYGIKKETPAKPKPEKKDSVDLYDFQSLLKDVELDVWHGDDNFIKTNARKRHKEKQKDTLACVYHVRDKRAVQLGTEAISEVKIGEQDNVLLAETNLPYAKSTTWRGPVSDYHVVDLKTGKTTLAVKEFEGYGKAHLSPNGQFVVYYRDQHWWSYSVRSGKTTNLTAQLPTSFADKRYDYPGEPNGFPLGGWVENDSAVLVHDNNDVWSLPLGAGSAYMITGGDGLRRNMRYRVIEMDEDMRFYKKGDLVPLTAFSNREKFYAFYRSAIGETYVQRRMEDYKKYEFIAKAKNADVVIFSREDYNEFPDIWAADSDFNHPKRLTTENPQVGEMNWGSAELVTWYGVDGDEHHGALFKPAGYEEGKRYPVLVYYYRIFSNRLYEFNTMAVNHRPNFPYYTSNGYAVFLPDIHFDVENPGLAATKSLVPGVQKLVEMGIADPDAIGLHGHSWSGYQSAFVITQTDIFKAVVSGAPVSNMTSAYSGIRLKSGLARQFQYEAGQSRIGHSMWDRRDLYIENSPVFFADRINTPMVIMFGDEDDAVPFQQGIELYMAMRRLDKPVVMLQYHGEPHHLKKYANKLDYTIKMKEFFDHYLKGGPAPTWWTEGVPYEGD